MATTGNGPYDDGILEFESFPLRLCSDKRHDNLVLIAVIVILLEFSSEPNN